MMKYKIVIVLLATVIIFSSGCGTEKQASTTVSRIDTLEKPLDKGMIYALPKTGLFFHIELIKTTVIPGPYNKYGEGLLGLSQVPHKLNTY